MPDTTGTAAPSPPTDPSTTSPTGRSTAAPTTPATARLTARRALLTQQAPLLLSLLMLSATLLTYAGLYLARQGIFPTTFDWTNVVNHSLPLALAAVGQGIVVLTRGLDLSIGGMVDLTNGLAATRLSGGPWETGVWILLILLIGAAGGLVNGLLVAWARLQPILVTVATLAIYQGLALWVLPTPGGQVPAGLTTALTDPDRPTGLVWVAAIAAAWFVFRRTRVGSGIVALGNDPEAAHASGLPVLRLTVIAYVASGFFAAAAGLFLAATTTAGDAVAGNVFVLTSIAAVVLGGISFFGGRGSLVGAIAGAFTLTLVVNVLFFAGIDPLYQSFYQGLFLIAAVLLGNAASRLARRAR